MPYSLTLVLRTFAAILWPRSWWQKAWHGLILLGAAFVPKIRQSLEVILQGMGIEGIENWHYYLSASVLAIITLGFQIAKFRTIKIIPIDIYYTEDDSRYYVKLTIKNRSYSHTKVWVRMKLRLGDQYKSYKGKENFVLLTEQRAAERALVGYDTSMRRRFNLGPGESKDVDICRIGKSLESMDVFEEIENIAMPVEPYFLEISINGGDKPWSGIIMMFVDDDSVRFQTMFSLPNCWLKLDRCLPETGQASLSGKRRKKS